MTGATALYTPQLLGLATSLTAYPWDESLPLRATARSKSCGSQVMLGLAVDEDGRLLRIGMKVQACAIGQAAAAVFASHAIGCNASMIATAEQGLSLWLGDAGPMPGWPGLALVAPARAYPARHAAIKLAWQAARDALHIG